MDSESIRRIVENADVVVLLINGKDLGSLFVDIGDYKCHPVEAEFTIAKSMNKPLHLFVPDSVWLDSLRDDALFAGTATYRLKRKALLSENCVSVDSPNSLPKLVVASLGYETREKEDFQMSKKITRILLVCANPRGTDPLRTAEEDRTLRESIQLSPNRDKVVVDPLNAATVKEFVRIAGSHFTAESNELLPKLR